MNFSCMGTANTQAAFLYSNLYFGDTLRTSNYLSLLTKNLVQFINRYLFKMKPTDIKREFCHYISSSPNSAPHPELSATIKIGAAATQLIANTTLTNSNICSSSYGLSIVRVFMAVFNNEVLSLPPSNYLRPFIASRTQCSI